ncbi:alpha/beta fold hydrolase [Nonomuraea sp. NPDC050153]|uniref:alpha/beta fold hydrolase n=1 Tax=Nonomuraea sp. NPDC050153 TaxID=3364359 RepID=UPI00378BB988
MSLFYEDVGDGPPVVLVHGWPLSCRFWEPQIGPLVEAGRRVVCYDRRGFGRSSRPWHGYDLDTFTADLTALIESLGLTGLALVGFSTGCAESLRYAAASGRVARLVLSSPVLYPDPLADELRIASARHRIPVLDDLLLRFFAIDGHSMLDEPTRQYLLRQAADASPKGTVDSLAAWGAADPGPDLARVTAPTLIVQGEGDAFVPPEDSGTRVARAIASSSLVIVPDAPHGVPLTHHERWNELILEFLAS